MCDASFTMLEIFGCVSSRRIWTRVRMGPTRDCKSHRSRLTFSDVRRIWKNKAVSITTCTTRAIAATMLKNSSQNCIGAPPAPLGSGTPCYCPAESLRLRFAEIRFAPGFDGRRDGILLAHRNVLAALDQFISALAEFASFLLRVILAFVSLLCKIFASILAGFRREENSHKGPYAKPYEEIRHLGTNIVRHDNLHRNRSIAAGRAQCGLTCISSFHRLCPRIALQMLEDLLRTSSRHEPAQFFQARTLNIGDASKLLQQFLRSPRAHARNIFQRGLRLAFAAPLPVEVHRESVGLVADLLNQVKHRGVALQHERFVLLA